MKIGYCGQEKGFFTRDVYLFNHIKLESQRVNMNSKRVCRDCPIPDCGSKYLVKLSNHLAQVHGLSTRERKAWLQEAKNQQIKLVRDYGNPVKSKPWVIIE